MNKNMNVIMDIVIMRMTGMHIFHVIKLLTMTIKLYAVLQCHP